MNAILCSLKVVHAARGGRIGTACHGARRTGMFIGNEERPSLHFLVDASNIFAEDASADQLNSAYEQNRDDDRREALNVSRAQPEDRDVRNSKKNHQSKRNERKQRDHQSDAEYDGQGHGREIEDAVCCEFDELEQRILCRAGGARRALIFNANLWEADPRPEAAEKPVPFRQAIYLSQYAFIDERKVTGIERRVD